MSKPKKPRYPRLRMPMKDSQLPATQGMIYLVHKELSHKLSSHSERFDSIDAKFDGVDARFNGVDARFDSLEHKMNSGFESLKAEITRLAVLIEGQDARNKVVLEGLTNLTQRQDRLEVRFQDVESTVRTIAGFRPGPSSN